VIDMLTTLIFIPDPEVQCDALYGIMNLTDDPSEGDKIRQRQDQEVVIQKYRMINESQIIHKLVKFLEKGSPMLHPSLRSLGNISSEGNAECDKQAVEAGIFIQSKQTFNIFTNNCYYSC
jgi:hypothetical protein